MQKEVSNIDMYWWEGFYGFDNVLRRLIRGKRPYVKNFGDGLSPLIISLLTGKSVRHVASSEKILALGSIFFALKDRDTVWGAGLLNAKHIRFALSCSQVHYSAVRGPETRKLLVQHNLECPEIYGDPAIILPSLIKDDVEKKYRIGIVPHFSQHEYFVSGIKKDEAITIVDVEKPLCDVMRNILSCEIILSTSLHGVIVGEAYGLPTLMLTVDKPLHGDFFKFEDYFHSTDRALSFAQVGSLNLNKLAELALNQPNPHFNSKSLLSAFPFKKQNILYPPTLSWSKMKDPYFSHSIIPPRFKVP